MTANIYGTAASDPQPTNIAEARRTRGAQNIVAAALAAAFVAGLGAWPHVRFSRAVGALTFFKGAYDEDTKVLVWWQGLAPASRSLSSFMFAALGVLSGHDINAILLAADVVLPVLAAVAAYVLASQTVVSTPARLLLVLLLLFGQDMLSLGNAAVWTGPKGLLLDRFREMFGSWGAILVPSYDTSYLALFRTPEPQIGFGLLFILLALLIRLGAEPKPPMWALVALFGVNVSISFSYVFLSVPAILLELGFTAVLLALRERRAASVLGGAVLTSGLIFGAGLLFQSRSAGHLVFHSRLPSATPAILVSLVATSLFLVWVLSCARRSPLGWLAVGLLAMPAVLGNQQVLTDMMVSTRDWERNANYPFLILGLALASTLICRRVRGWRANLSRFAALFLSVTLAWSVVQAQRRSYEMWYETNALSVAMTRALARAGNIDATTPLLLSEPGLAPLLRVRTGDRYPMMLDYTWLFTTPVPPLAEGITQEFLSPYEDKLFVYWRRIGTTPEEAEEVLTSEARQRGGYFIAYLFSFRDHWYPATDNRHVRQQEILARIPAVVNRYRAFLAAPSGEFRASPVIYLTRLPPDAVRAVSGFRLIPLACVEALGYRVCAHRQVGAGRD